MAYGSLTPKNIGDSDNFVNDELKHHVYPVTQECAIIVKVAESVQGYCQNA
jgi:hypothetical protein